MIFRKQAGPPARRPRKRNSMRPSRQTLPEKRRPDEGQDWNGILRVVLIWALIFGAIPLFSWLSKRQDAGIKQFTYTEFLKAVQDGQIKDVMIASEATGNEVVRGALVLKKGETATKEAKEYKAYINLSFDRDLSKELKEKGIPVKIEPAAGFWSTFLMSSLPFLLPLVFLWFLFSRQMRSMGKGAFSFGKSRARLLSRDKNRMTFKDVAGIEEAKEEVQEIVEFLKDPKRFQRLGGRIPKGVLMIGPPGTGKTLLAKAIAGEADVPFFSISGSDFVEMFVGVGASRVRDMFEQGRKAAPCLIFVDEIDAVGRSRFTGIGGGHDEREQTLNALLVEMDGFDTQEGVILIAATNRPDVLDPALLRPGRFDRQIAIDLPDVKGREEILRVHARKVKLSDAVDLSVIARGTPGFAGADLANLLNEAALLAARDQKKAIGMIELEEARDKVRFGRERRSRVMDDKDKEITAYHEAGHAVVAASLENTEPIHKVTIIPRGNAYLGATMQLPEKDHYTYGRKKVLDELTVYMGGRIAEEMIFSDITSGAYGDIRGATRLARKMVCEWGMSDKMGFIEYGEKEQQVFVGRDMSHGREFSEATAQAIDAEVRRIVDECYARAKRIIEEKRDKLEVLAKTLLECETLDGAHVKEILKTGKLANPPMRRPPPVPQPQPEPVGAPAEIKVGSTEVRPAPSPAPSPA